MRRIIKRLISIWIGTFISCFIILAAPLSGFADGDSVKIHDQITFQEKTTSATTSDSIDLPITGDKLSQIGEIVKWGFTISGIILITIALLLKWQNQKKERRKIGELISPSSGQ